MRWSVLFVVCSALLPACPGGMTGPGSDAGPGHPDGGALGGGDAGADAGSPSPDAGTLPPPFSGDTPTLECDPIDPAVCGYPFPNNVFTVADDTSPTGRRLALAPLLFPVTDDGEHTNPTKWNVADGFSAGTPLLTFMPGATNAGLPALDDIEASLQPDCPTVVLDATTGERIPHFAELDFATDHGAERSLIVRPVIGLEPAQRYIVALRHIQDADGQVLPPSAAFAALRDRANPDDERTALYDDIFAHLAAAGVSRDDVQIAWDFTTGSVDNSTGRLLSMRDAALADIEARGVGIDITDVEPDWSAFIAYRVRGTLAVPRFLDSVFSGAYLNLGPDGLPVMDGTVDIPFTLLVPYAAPNEPARVAMVGHGLLTSRDQVEAQAYQVFAQEENFALAAVDWQGMSQTDVPTIIGFIFAGEMHQFATVPDRLQQSIINFIALRKALEGPLATDPALNPGGMPLLSPEPVTYFGSSQGGILGTVLLAVDPGLSRGVLDVAGTPYSLMLTRSQDFDLFLGLMKGQWSDARDIQLMIALAQQLWDRAEPSGYARHLNRAPLAGVTADKQALLTLAIGDHQVPTVSGHLLARELQMPLIGPANRDVWGVDVVDENAAPPWALVEYDFGLPPEPLASQPMDEGDDPHPKLRGLPHYRHMRGTFLRSGIVTLGCDGACDPD